MAASKDKTSKTAHVMNLLSRNRGDAPETPPAPEASVPEAAAPAAAPVAPAAPILSPVDADAAVSSQIKNALEAELEAAAAPVQETAAPTAPAAPVAPASQAAAPQAAAPAAAPAPAAEEPDEGSVSYVNVIQVLVEEKAEKYMEMFGLCRCDKCQADVKAYALNHLAPKYVVMGEREMIPKLTFYEMQNSSDITAQIIKACKIVMNRPHHNRE